MKAGTYMYDVGQQFVHDTQMWFVLYPHIIMSLARVLLNFRHMYIMFYHVHSQLIYKML